MFVYITLTNRGLEKDQDSRLMYKRDIQRNLTKVQHIFCIIAFNSKYCLSDSEIMISYHGSSVSFF